MIHRQQRIVQFRCDAGGVGVVIGQPSQIVLEGVQAGSRQDSHLAHPPAQHLAEAMSPGDGIAVCRKYRAHRRTQSLGKTHAHRIDRSGQLREGRSRRDVGVPQASPIEVHPQAATVGQFGDFPQVFQGQDPPPGAVMRVLHAHQGRRRAVDVVRIEGRLHQSGGEDASGGGNAGGQKAAEGGGAAHLIAENVGAVLQEDLVPVAGLGAQGELVAHGSAGNEKGGFLAQQARHLFLQPVHGGVVTEDIVSHLGRGHGLAHTLVRPGHRIAAHIDQGI